MTRAPDEEWDAGEMGCGELILDLRTRLRALKPHALFRLVAHDLGAKEDIPAWCKLTGHKLLHAEHPIYDIEVKEA